MLLLQPFFYYSSPAVSLFRMRHPAQGGWVMPGLVFKWFPLCEFSLFDTPWQPTPVLLPGESHGQRSLVGCSPWGR